MLYKLALIVFFFTTSLSVLALDLSNQTCTLDSECSQAGNLSHFDASGDWFCSKGRCKYLVAAGQPCQVASDCAVSSLTLFSDGCSAEHCGLQSLCDAPTNRPLQGQLKCCKPLAPMAICPSDSSLNLCSEGQACLNGKCDLVNNTARQIWLGVVLVICGAVTLNIGLNLQKLGYRRWSPQLGQFPRPATTMTTTMISEDDVIMRDTTVISVMGTATEGRAGVTTMEGTIPATMEQENGGICEKISFWRQVPLTNPIWLVGFVLFILGNISGFIALRYAPQSLVAPLGAFSIVTNVVIAPYINNESLSWWDGLGVGLICLGSTMTVIFSGYVAPEYKLCVLLALLQQRATIIYLLVIGTLIFLIYIFIKVTEGRLIKRLYNWWLNKPRLYNDNSRQVYKLEHSAVAAAAAAIDTIEEEEDEEEGEDEEEDEEVREETFAFKYCLPLAYSSLGALMATLTTLFAKSLINLLVISFTTQQNQFTSFLSWIILLVTMITALSQIYWINMGLKRYDAMLQVPVFYCVWTVFDIIGGGIYYNEFRAFTLLKYILFGLGVAVIFTGIVFLARRLHH